MDEQAEKEIEMTKQASIFMDAYETEKMSDPRDGILLDRASSDSGFFLKKVLCSSRDFEERMEYFVACERINGDSRSLLALRQEAFACLNMLYLPID